MKLIILILCLLPSLALADDWDAFGQPGAMAIMRHALASGTSDPPEFELGNCATQRNLDERGRMQARRIGQALRDRGIAFDQVLSSQWCRTLETAELLDLGPVIPEPSLNSFFEDRSTRARQTKEARAILEQADGRLMLVTHQVNISALVGQSTSSGEVLIIRLTETGVELLGRVLIAP